jgi:hypothetical protein
VPEFDQDHIWQRVRDWIASTPSKLHGAAYNICPRLLICQQPVVVWSGKKQERRLGDGEINTVNSNHLEMATSDQVQMPSLLILRKVMEAANVAGVEHPRT